MNRKKRKNDDNNFLLQSEDDTERTVSKKKFLSDVDFQLPHEILLQIMKNLTIAERCKCARVCKAWSNACYDETLWYHIDLSEISVDLKKLWKLLRHKCFVNAKSIKICGNLNNNSSEK
jgi:hypothetical protein